jgi:hypothetical protein
MTDSAQGTEDTGDTGPRNPFPAGPAGANASIASIVLHETGQMEPPFTDTRGSRLSFAILRIITDTRRAGDMELVTRELTYCEGQGNFGLRGIVLRLCEAHHLAAAERNAALERVKQIQKAVLQLKALLTAERRAMAAQAIDARPRLPERLQEVDRVASHRHGRPARSASPTSGRRREVRGSTEPSRPGPWPIGIGGSRHTAGGRRGGGRG